MRISAITPSILAVAYSFDYCILSHNITRDLSCHNFSLPKLALMLLMACEGIPEIEAPLLSFRRLNDLFWKFSPMGTTSLVLLTPLLTGLSLSLSILPPFSLI